MLDTIDVKPLKYLCPRCNVRTITWKYLENVNFSLKMSCSQVELKMLLGYYQKKIGATCEAFPST